MKLIRFGESGNEKTGVIINEKRYDVSSVIKEYDEENAAHLHIAGYCLHNDYSERAFQLERGGQWVKGKSCDTFAPLGPFIALADDIEDVNNLRLWLTVNGKMMQNGNTSNLIFN